MAKQNTSVPKNAIEQNNPAMLLFPPRNYLRIICRRKKNTQHRDRQTKSNCCCCPHLSPASPYSTLARFSNATRHSAGQARGIKSRSAWLFQIKQFLNSATNSLYVPSPIQESQQNIRIIIMASNKVIKSIVAKRLMSSASGSESSRYISPVSALSQISHKVSPFEQRLLVWSGQFKKITDVPSLVSRDTMERARNHYRIRVNLIIAGIAVVGSFAMVISGKNAAHRGENINDYNAEWHRRYNEAHKFDPTH